jgi:hypothetical protein
MINKAMLGALALLGLLTACGSTPEFVAPEIEPPEDLLISDPPEGYALVSGFELEAEGPQVRGSLPDGDRRLQWQVEFTGSFSSLRSPAGNVIEGVYYQSSEGLLIITKSNFPNGSLEEWRSGYLPVIVVANDCLFPKTTAAGMPFIESRMPEIAETRTVEGVEVVVLEKPAGGWITVFMRGDYLLTVEGALSLEETLAVVTSLVGQ